MSNKMQLYTVYFIWKLLYMFRVKVPPIIRSANNCIYSIYNIGLSFMRFEVAFAVNVYILIFSVTTACSLYVRTDITEKSTDCIFMVES